jgi:hypothetical protein
MVILTYKSEMIKYSSNKYSQNGEDGIIAEILKRLKDKINNYYLCEFGAWDGVYASNTFKLVQENDNITALYIEGDPDKYKELVDTTTKFTNIIPLCAYVDYKDNENSLDNILKKYNFPLDFLILSIDIDSWDYQVFKKMEIYRPIIIIIEINSSISPLNNDHIHNGDTMFGTAFMPMYMLALQKGYKLVCHTGNMIFIRNDYNQYLQLNNNNIQDVLNMFNPMWLRANNYDDYMKIYE